jgi:hypothetical protein
LSELSRLSGNRSQIKKKRNRKDKEVKKPFCLQGEFDSGTPWSGNCISNVCTGHRINVTELHEPGYRGHTSHFDKCKKKSRLMVIIIFFKPELDI